MIYHDSSCCIMIYHDFFTNEKPRANVRHGASLIFNIDSY